MKFYFIFLEFKDRTTANVKDFDFALDRIAMGIGRKNMFITEEDKRLTAIHEGGHTIAALLTEGATPIHKVTILPRGGALGFVSIQILFFSSPNDQMGF